jgi:GNAT superfamily N-acetyltransferase
MIRYTDRLDAVGPNHLQGFFTGWPDPPSPSTHLRILQGSDHFLLAIDSDTGDVVGFVTAITDGISCAYLPHLEVRPDHRGRGVGTELVRGMLERLDNLYMIDLVCDENLRPFYERLGFQPSQAMIVRNYSRQQCEET